MSRAGALGLEDPIVQGFPARVEISANGVAASNRGVVFAETSGLARGRD